MSTLSMEPVDQKEIDKDGQSNHIEASAEQGQEIFWTEEEEKKLVRKIDFYLLPNIWIMYLLSYMDRTNIGNAKIAGMGDDLGLTSNQYSVALVVFFGASPYNYLYHNQTIIVPS
jgi:sugar (pentulose or hexulose) kinase